MGRPSKLTLEVTKRLTEAIRAGNYNVKSLWIIMGGSNSGLHN